MANVTFSSPVASGADMLTAEGDAADLHRAGRLPRRWSKSRHRRARDRRRGRIDRPERSGGLHAQGLPWRPRLGQMAVKAGGAILHRAGLSETELVFAEHRVFLRDESLASIAQRLAAEPFAADPDRRRGRREQPHSPPSTRASARKSCRFSAACKPEPAAMTASAKARFDFCELRSGRKLRILVTMLSY